jgi:hypothetical protein
MIRRAEAQGVHRRDRPRAHGEDVAQNAADAGRRTLIRFDVGGWLWLSILKTTQSPSPISTTPAFSPGPWMTTGPVVGSVRSHFLNSVGTVLVPHRREDAEFGEGRLAADQIEDALVFVGLQPVRLDQLVIGDFHGVRDRHIGGRHPFQVAGPLAHDFTGIHRV